MSAAKAFVAGLITGLSSLLNNWTSEVGDKVTARDLVVALLAAIVAFGAVYFTPNRP